MITRDFFDAERCTDDTTTLSEDGVDEVMTWLEALVNHGYEIREPKDYWNAAGFLVGQYTDEQGIDEIMVILATAIVGVEWDLIKEELLD